MLGSRHRHVAEICAKHFEFPDSKGHSFFRVGIEFDVPRPHRSDVIGLHIVAFASGFIYGRSPVDAIFAQHDAVFVEVLIVLRTSLAVENLETIDAIRALKVDHAVVIRTDAAPFALIRIRTLHAIDNIFGRFLLVGRSTEALYRLLQGHVLHLFEFGLVHHVAHRHFFRRCAHAVGGLDGHLLLSFFQGLYRYFGRGERSRAATYGF